MLLPERPPIGAPKGGVLLATPIGWFRSNGIFLGSDHDLSSPVTSGWGDYLNTHCQEHLLAPYLDGELDQRFLNTGQGTLALESTGRSRFLGSQSLEILISILQVPA